MSEKLLTEQIILNHNTNLLASCSPCIGGYTSKLAQDLTLLVTLHLTEHWSLETNLTAGQWSSTLYITKMEKLQNSVFLAKVVHASLLMPLNNQSVPQKKRLSSLAKHFCFTWFTFYLMIARSE